MNVPITKKNLPQCALIGGVSGVEGRALLSYLCSMPQDEYPFILGHSVEDPGQLGVHQSSRIVISRLDLLDEKSIETFKRECGDMLKRITVAFYTILYDTGDDKKNQESNGIIFKRWCDMIFEMCPNLTHINLQTGTKYYGCHLGPFKTPAKEFDPRHKGQNFYYIQEDYLAEVCGKSDGKCTYAVLRPNEVVGFAPGKPLMIGATIAFYGLIAKTLGKKLIFPGNECYFNAVIDCVDANLLAKAHVHTSMVKECANKAFNVSNGDVFRWKYMWPIVAAYFGVEWEGPQKDPNNPGCHLTLGAILEQWGASKVFSEIATKNDLRIKDLSGLVSVDHFDSVFSRRYDNFSNTSLIRLLGFKEYLPTEQCFVRLCEQLMEHRFLPSISPSVCLKYCRTVNDIEPVVDALKNIELSAVKILGMEEGLREKFTQEPGRSVPVEKEE